MNKYIAGGIVGTLLLVIFIFTNKDVAEAPMPSMLLGTATEVTRYQIGEGFTEYGFISFSFTGASDEIHYAQAFIDHNADGQVGADEWVVQNKIAKVVPGYVNRFGFTLPANMMATGSDFTTLPVTLALTSEVSTYDTVHTGESITTEARVNTEEIVEQFGLNVPGAREDLKRGVGIAVAHAEDLEETGVPTDALPDLTGGPMDCFAIATANNLINMTTQHDRRGDLPTDTAALITELKELMQWNDGIINPNFMTGKAAFVEKYDLPITTTEILRPSLEDLHDAFENGDAIEVSTTMLRSRSGHANTGHVLTGVSTYQDGEEAGLAVHDPATSEGVDILELDMTGGEKPYILVKYPMWDGIVIVDAIYVQHWNEEEEEIVIETSSIQLEDEDSENETAVSGGLVAPTNMETSFAHVAPGEYSEVYAVVTGLHRGQEVTGRLHGAQHTGTPQVVVADDNGVAHFTYRINQYGDYSVIVSLDDTHSISSDVTVN